MSVKTPADILLDIEAQISASWGNTTLSDPQSNVSDPLVQSQLPAAVGLSRLYERLEAFTAGLSPRSATGQKLSTVAELMGQPRSLAIPSFVPVFFTGSQCSNIPVDTVLIDHSGVEWKTLSNARINREGFAYVNAQSSVGAHDLFVGELNLQGSITGVTYATNPTQPDVGGDSESDEALRRRLFNIRPHWRLPESKNGLLKV